jgi:hypothetical protein
MSTDQWAPYDDGSSVNEWASVGSGHTECKKHTAYGLKPAWGTTAGVATYQSKIMCMVTPTAAIEWNAGSSQRVMRFAGWQMCKACTNPDFPYDSPAHNGRMCYNNKASAAAGSSNYNNAWCTNDMTFELLRSKARCMADTVKKGLLGNFETAAECADAVAADYAKRNSRAVVFEFGEGPACKASGTSSIKKCPCLYLNTLFRKDFETATCSFGFKNGWGDSMPYQKVLEGQSAGGFFPNDEFSTYSLFPAQQWSKQKYFDSSRTADQTMCATARPAFISRAGKCRFWYESNGQMCVSTEKYPTQAQQQAAGYSRAAHTYAANEGCTIEVTVNKFKAVDLDFNAYAQLNIQGSSAQVASGLNTFTKYTGTAKRFDRGMIRWTPGGTAGNWAGGGNKLGFKICTPLWNE